MRRTELLLVVALLVGALLAGLAGLRTAPSEEVADPRLSTLLSGPAGAAGLREALEALELEVETWRRPLFGLATDTSFIGPGETLALLDVSRFPTGVEQAALTRYVVRGGRLFSAGWNRVEECFGYEVVRADDRDSDSVRLRLPPGVGDVPPTEAVLHRKPPTDDDPSGMRFGEGAGDGCERVEPRAVDTLLATAAGVPVALRLGFAGGGEATLVADGGYLSNRILKETDAGALVLPWILEPRPTTFVVDEYHQGFAEGGSIWKAAWRWMVSAPIWWVMLQLLAAGLLALGVGAVRFGPAVRVTERRRRSPMEHLDALAVGLERAGGGATAVELMASGLRRRLRRSPGVRGPAGPALRDWLRSLELAAPTPEARTAVERLGRILREPGGEERPLHAAIAVEDVWEALGHRSKLEPS